MKDKLKTLSYRRRLSIFLVLYSISTMMMVLRDPPEGSLVRWMTALLPVLWGLLITRTLIQHIRQSDELQRRIYLEAFAVAFPITALIALTVGLLDYVGVQQLNGAWYVTIMLVLWVIGQIMAKRKYE